MASSLCGMKADVALGLTVCVSMWVPVFCCMQGWDPQLHWDTARRENHRHLNQKWRQKEGKGGEKVKWMEQGDSGRTVEIDWWRRRGGKARQGGGLTQKLQKGLIPYFPLNLMPMNLKKKQKKNALFTLYYHEKIMKKDNLILLGL